MCVDRIFDQIEPRFTLLGLVETFIAWGRDITEEKGKLLLIPEQEGDRYNEGGLQHIKESEISPSLNLAGYTTLKSTEKETLLYI